MGKDVLELLVICGSVRTVSSLTTRTRRQCSLSNAYTSSDQRRDNPSGMARVNDGSHSFACQPHVYPRMEWANLHSLRKHSPDGAARARQRTSGSAYYSSIDLERMKGWVGLVRWPYSGWFTHISGHPSTTGGAWDRESSLVKDRRSTTVRRSQRQLWI